jgi:hypothetical protein
MSLLAVFKKIIGLKVRHEALASNDCALTFDEIRILDAVKKTREWRQYGKPLCNNFNCSTGCNMRFRMIVKENLADNDIDKKYFHALEPKLRDKVKLFCENRRDLLELIESIRLYSFYTDLDERIPEEAKLKKEMEEQQNQVYKKREEAWKKNIEEKRAAKKQEKQLRHKQRLVLKRERDRYYWVAYWAAKHAIREEKINSLRFKKRRKLISVYFFLKKYFFNFFAN